VANKLRKLVGVRRKSKGFGGSEAWRGPPQEIRVRTRAPWGEFALRSRKTRDFRPPGRCTDRCAISGRIERSTAQPSCLGGV